ncbi:MAG: hypothetical protein KAJ18_08720, partial [Candidatus Omnitrophica bacterium]|nr:hypothetical protein [Candidatus Omnitrophota bacterium]
WRIYCPKRDKSAGLGYSYPPNPLIQQFPGIETKLFDKNGKLLNYVDIYVNQESSYPEELAKSVKDVDELFITFMIAGGARLSL